MLGIDARAARATWTVLLVALVVAAAYAIRETLAVFCVALLFAYLLMPLVGLLERFTPKRISPRFALAIVYLALLGAIIAMSVTLGSRIIDEARDLAARLPDLLKNREWINRIPLPYWLEPLRMKFIQMLESEIDSGGRQILPYLKNLGGDIVTGAKYVVYIVLIPILAFFFLKDGREMRRQVVDNFDDGRRRVVVDEIFEDINRLLGRYIRALVLLSLSSFTSYSLFLGITGAQFALLLAGIAALGEFIPVFGPAAAGGITLLVTGLTGYAHVIWFAIFWVVFRLFQDYMLSPYVMGKGVELNPVLVLFGVLAGDQIAGIIGMFFSVPVIATLRVIFVRLQRTSRTELVEPRPEI